MDEETEPAARQVTEQREGSFIEDLVADAFAKDRRDLRA